jgi:NifU-like protein involved in Fe-S cluster formation
MKKNKIKTCGSLYTPKVMATFKNPHNYGRIKNADGIGKVGNPVCGDVMNLYIKVGKGEIIKDFYKFYYYRFGKRKNNKRGFENYKRRYC